MRITNHNENVLKKQVMKTHRDKMRSAREQRNL